MSTQLHAISNIETTKEEVLANKGFYLEKLKALQLEHTSTPLNDDKGNFIGWKKSEGDWEYEFPTIYDAETDSVVADTEAAEIIYFYSPFEFAIRVYDKCLELICIYKYNYLYAIGHNDALNEFRKNVYDIISIFGGTEIIYLADNGCDKLSEYLELQVWEGFSYQSIKKGMLLTGLPFVSDYGLLNHDKLTYSKITEFVFDDFSDIKT
ncbi:MAG TPA: hypothetical protein VFM65_01515 [Flavobacteriaceae bacterium]|nr:hypothetical protein [Flavobacteriaceae bacterium]